MIHVLSAQVNVHDEMCPVWDRQIGFTEPRARVYLELDCTAAEASELIEMLRGGRVPRRDDALALTSGVPQLPSGPVVYDAEEIE